MNKFILGLMALTLFSFAACSSEEPVDVTQTETPVETVEEAKSYNFDLPEDYSLYTSGFDVIIPEGDYLLTHWYGPVTDFGSEGFYLRTSESSQYEVMLDQYANTPITEALGIDGSSYVEAGTTVVNGIEMDTLVLPTEIGFSMKAYFFEMDGTHYELIAVESNETAINTIETLRFE